jgi:transcription antitermination factor NusG
METAVEATPDWYAFRVRARHEKSAALQLQTKHEECFLPLVRQARMWANRLTYVDLPLIPGYVFCRSYRFALLPILKTPGVVDVVRIGAHPAPIPADEIEALERAMKASLVMEPYAYVDTGQKVAVRAGPLAGVSGTVVEHEDTKHLVLSVALLRRSVLVHVDDLADICDIQTTGLISEGERICVT